MSTDEWREVEWPKRNIERLDGMLEELAARFDAVEDRVERGGAFAGRELAELKRELARNVIEAEMGARLEDKIRQVGFLIEELTKRMETVEDRFAATSKTSMITHDRLSSLEGWPTEKQEIKLDPPVKFQAGDMPIVGFYGLKRGFENGTIRPSTKRRAFAEKLISESWVDPACGHTRSGDDRDGPCPLNHGVTTWSCRFDGVASSDPYRFIAHLRKHLDKMEDEAEDRKAIAEQPTVDRIKLAVAGGPEFVLALAERRVRDHMRLAYSQASIDAVCTALRGAIGTTAQSSARQNSALDND